jgi:hypothetical protein
LTLASYKDFSQDVYCKSKKKIINFSFCIRFLLGCYQDKLHPHERNRKQLETKFKPGGGSNATTAAPAAEPAGEEE